MALAAGTIISLKGEKGDKGIDFIVGQGAPTIQGVEGAGYIDADAADVYYFANGSWVKARNLVGPMGINGFNGQLLTGTDVPDASTYSGAGDAIYIRANGLVYTYDGEGDRTWVDSGTTLAGPKGDKGDPGERGTKILHGDGEFVPANYPNAAVGDMYVDDTGPSYTFLVSA